MERNDIVRLALDAYHGNVQNFSVDETMDTLRQALVAANGGSTKLDYKAVRDGRASGVFSIIEEIITKTVEEGLTGDEYFNQFVDYKNIALGDTNLFVVEDDTLFSVDEIAPGTQGLRRQRLAGASTISIPTKVYGVKIYEELDRVLAGLVDFNAMIAKVSKSFDKKIMDEIFAVWTAATATDLGGTAYVPAAGSYSEDALLDVIAHVEANTGAGATIIGTKKALRNLRPSVDADPAWNDMYNNGYYGKFYGTPVIAINQRHATGTTNFLLPDNVITIVASNAEKPIKVINEGETTIVMGDPMTNPDFSQEFFMAQRLGIGLLTTGEGTGIGRYEFTA